MYGRNHFGRLVNYPTPSHVSLNSRPMSFTCPPAGCPPHLALIWPLIWLQVLALRLWVRTHYGRGQLFRWAVTPTGYVYLDALADIADPAPARDLWRRLADARRQLQGVMEGLESTEAELPIGTLASINVRPTRKPTLRANTPVAGSICASGRRPRGGVD